MWSKRLSAQFERVKKTPGESPKATFQRSLAASWAATQALTKRHSVRMDEWRVAAEQAPFWAVEHRLAVAESFWHNYEARVAAGRLTGYDAVGQVKLLLDILPPQASSPLVQKALAVLGGREAAISKLSRADREQAAMLRARLQCEQELSEL